MARKESTSVNATGFVAPCACAGRERGKEKLTTRAPEPMIASRRDIWMFMCASPHAWADARFTARTLRACVPQRQRLFASAFLISVSLGFLFLARKAADSMIMPLIQ